MARLHLSLQACRLFAALAGALGTLAPSAAAYGEEQFPYVAYVVHNDAQVRSGPGERYYATQQLAQGFAVEVYRHDGDGWCAIRPPEGSYSWIPARDVKIVDSNVGEIVTDRIVTRVGSTLTPDRTAVQVLLERGERVALVPGALTEPDWLRIVAPAGEFRWIAARDLGRQAPVEVSPPSAPTNAWASSSLQPNGAAGNAFGHLAPAATTDTFTAHSSAAQVDVVAGSPAELQLAQFQSQATGPVSAPGLIDPRSSSLQSTAPRIRLSSATAPARTFTAEEIPDRLRQLELELSQMVTAPAQEWQLDGLRAEANAMLAQSQDVAVSSELRELLDRIARFQQVRDGYNQLAQGPVTTPITETEVPGYGPDYGPTLGLAGDPVSEIVQNVRDRVREDLGTSDDAISADQRQYDAVGMLKPVVSRRQGAPRYALVDSTGEVVSFVTPTPDLNLRPYVGRRIGINGSRGFMNEYRRAHVTAGRVTPIESTVRR